ncbi:MAG: PqqD family protein [Planctomycetes bacterium]|nr:PqqD family protein [Planctomycetota bacterium]
MAVKGIIEQPPSCDLPSPERGPSTPQRREHFLRHDLDGEAVLYDETFDVIYRLNETGLFIWEACNGMTPADEIAERLADAYGVTARVALADVRSAIEQMAEVGLLVTAEDASSL